MAQKKEPSIQDAVEYFKNIIDRIGVTEFIYQNRTLLCTNGKCSIIINIDQLLWNQLIDDESFKSKLFEVNPIDKDKVNMLTLGDESGSWIDIDIDEFITGKLINITIEGYDYNIAICKDLLPIKLKKAEFNNISYQISTIKMGNVVNKILKLRKTFPGIVDDTSFGIMIVFIVV